MFVGAVDLIEQRRRPQADRPQSMADGGSRHQAAPALCAHSSNGDANLISWAGALPLKAGGKVV
jgi:hypothetical protein